jgi:hypothetical protein
MIPPMTQNSGMAPEKVSWLKKLEARYAWSFWGLVAGLIGIALAIWSVREKRPEVSYVVVSESNVLDVHTPVAALDVLYQGESLQKRALNLRIVTIRVQNTGDLDILQGAYDQQTPWGFRITSGRIVEIRVVGASSQYLSMNLRPHLVSPEQVSFAKVILDRGSYLTVQCLVVHSKGADPAVVPTGKIAGIQQLVILKQPASGGGQFFRDNFGGPLQIQVIRTCGYGLAFLFVVIGSIGVIAGISEKAASRTRRLRSQRVKVALDGINISKRGRKLVEAAFVRGGLDELRGFRELVGRPDELKGAVEEFKLERTAIEKLLAQDSRRHRDEAFIHQPIGMYRTVTVGRAAELVASQVVKENVDGTVTVDSDLERVLNEIITKLGGA